MGENREKTKRKQIKNLVFVPAVIAVEGRFPDSVNHSEIEQTFLGENIEKIIFCKFHRNYYRAVFENVKIYLHKYCLFN